MKLSTKALASLMIVALLAISAPTVSANQSRPNQKRVEWVYRHHDRKMELRASVLGLSPDELREQLKIRPLETIIKQHGFRDRAAYYVALTGKAKDELLRRGWTENKIDKFLKKRLDRLGKNTSVNRPS